MTADPSPARVAADRGRIERRAADTDTQRRAQEAAVTVEPAPPVPAATLERQGDAESREARPYFDVTEGDWRVLAEPTERGEARVRFWFQGRPFRELTYPGYKVWNIAAHLHDIAADFEHGMSLASWTGFPSVVWE